MSVKAGPDFLKIYYFYFNNISNTDTEVNDI